MEISSLKMPVKKGIYLKRDSGFVYLEHFSPCLDASAALKSKRVKKSLVPYQEDYYICNIIGKSKRYKDSR